MKRVITTVLAVLMISGLTACGGNADTKNTISPTVSPEVGSESGDNKITNIDSLNDLEVDKGIFDVTLTIPASFLQEEMTQADYDSLAAESGYQSVTLNEDGSATYIMTKSQHRKLMDEISTSIDESLNAFIGSEEYPNIVSIEKNDDYTDFTVVTQSETAGVEESIATFGFYMFSGMYHVFNGTEVDDVSVKFVNEASGEVIHVSNSDE